MLPRPHQLTATLLCMAALCFGAPASAGIVNYNFSVEVTSGPLAPQTFHGSFAYDDASTPGIGFGGEDLYALTSFSFDFGGTTFDLAALSYGDAAILAGNFIGLDAAGPTFLFQPAIGPLPPAFLYDVPGLGTGDGEIDFRARQTVPEPSTGLLAAALFAGLALFRRPRVMG